MSNNTKSNTNKKEKSAMSAVIIASLAYLVLGFVMVLFPNSVSNVLCYALGIVLTVYGLFNIITFFISRDSNLYFELIVGVTATAFGIFTLFSPNIVSFFIPVYNS